jgi:drug/metabolite transporter (DMT)-like permease
MIGLSHIPAVLMVALKLSIAALFILPFALGQVLKAKFTREDWYYFLSAGVLGGSFAQLTQVISRYSFTPSASDIAFWLSVSPVFSVFLAYFFLRERISFAKFVGIATGVLAMILVLGSWERPSTFSPLVRYPREELVIILSALCWAGFTLIAKRMATRHPPMVSAAMTLSVGSVVPLVWSIANGQFAAVSRLGNGDWVLLIILGVVGAGLAYLLWFQALGQTDTTKCLVVLMSTPVALTLLRGTEIWTGVTGPSPMIEVPLRMGILLTVLGVVAVWKD